MIIYIILTKNEKEHTSKISPYNSVTLYVHLPIKFISNVSLTCVILVVTKIRELENSSYNSFFTYFRFPSSKRLYLFPYSSIVQNIMY